MSWTAQELTTLRADLSEAAARLELEVAGHRVAGDLGDLHDDTDVASARIDSLQDAVQVENSMTILEQTRHVIARLDAGLYGACETCGEDIGRGRLEAFPRATLCIPCLS